MQYLLNFKCVGYVENEKFCQDVIRQRQEDGLLSVAPIFGDIREFNREYAETYKGMVDLVTAGFPCQPFSVAGKQKGEDDSRNMWPETIRAIRMVRPRYAFLENVPGLLVSGYMPTIFADLAQAGYNARWTVLGAHNVGAVHKRERLWILAYTFNNSDNRVKRQIQKKDRIQEIGGKEVCPRMSCGTSSSLGSNTIGNRRKTLPKESIHGEQELQGRKDLIILQGQRELSDSFEPKLLRSLNDMACTMDRLKAIGNGQVPIVAATAWEILSET